MPPRHTTLPRLRDNPHQHQLAAAHRPSYQLTPNPLSRHHNSPQTQPRSPLPHNTITLPPEEPHHHNWTVTQHNPTEPPSPPALISPSNVGPAPRKTAIAHRPAKKKHNASNGVPPGALLPTPPPSHPDGHAATHDALPHARHSPKDSAAHAPGTRCIMHARLPLPQTGPAYVTLVLTPAPLNVACPLLYPHCK